MEPKDYNKLIELKEDVNGYFYFTDKDHPLAYKSNYRVYFHRHCASLKIGRWVVEEEHVHHFNENKHDNSLKNLIIVDPSTHAKIHNQSQERRCKFCDNSYFLDKNHPSTLYCSEQCCQKGGAQKKKADWPESAEMKKMVWSQPTTKIAEKLGVSDKAVDKFCKKHGIPKPPRGYWRKIEVKSLFI